MATADKTKIRAVRVVVSGTVQGVWFRAHTQQRASDLGLGGFVRNLPDGTVEIVAEGTPESVDRLVEWSWTGSPHSSVSDVAVEERSPVGYPAFETRY